MPSNGRRGHVFSTVKSRKSSGGKKGNRSPSEKSTTKSGIIHCYFLELPAEIRNRIYHFARGKVYDECLTPPLLRKGCRTSIGGIASPSQLGTLSYRALTQVCKQIRSEFRPIWLRQSCFRMKLPAVAQFITAYYPKVADYQNAPKLLLISWDHGMTEDEFGEIYEDYDGLDEGSMEHVLTDITLLVRLRAHCPTFTAKFISRRILEDDVPNAMCYYCGHSIYCTCDNGCNHADAFDQARWEMVESYQYLKGLNAFLTNSNDFWLQMLRDNVRVRTLVEFTFDVNTGRPTIFVRFSQNYAPKSFHPHTMYNDSLILLNRLGMLDLKHDELLDYVVGEANGKHTRHLGGINLQVQYNQILLDGPTIASWKKENEANASIP
ncbi:hypothetical protein ACET3X_002983 [Alternaria dauci]|uniref:F-box domain-containing protein n=1 Tax=Alternaria dauci TaxID=48095 RepID=A0ABR3UR41_9PLEO